VDKNLIVKLLHSCAAPSAEEAEEVMKLKTLYPYSQAIHALAAKLSNDFQLSGQTQVLQLAAVYSSDRARLKDLMTGVLQNETHEVKEESSPQETASNSTRTKEASSATPATKKIHETIDSVDVADTVMSDLQKLSELKHNFEMLFADHTTVSLPVSLEAKTDGVKESAKSKKERIVEMAKTINNVQEKEENKDQTQPVARKKRKEHTEELIEQIKTTKEELEPENEKQKEQIEIIEHFIKKQPSISNTKEKSVEILPDLNTIKSGEFGENIVSETLVEILLKQGKKDRAIEVLKKLIWKYPQKKAYFASQIEELKK
jgi:hypothetical protein